MTASRNTGHSTAGTPSPSLLDGLPSISRYDLVLAAIPLVFAIALTVHALASIPFQLAVAAGALVSLLLLVDAVYLNPPAGSGSDGTTP